MWYVWVSDKIGLNALFFKEAGTLPAAMVAVELLLCIVGAYLMGSFNTAIFISKRIYGKDVRDYGSGNGGLTNMLRVFGKKAALYVLIGDMLKSALAVFWGAWVLGGVFSPEDGAYLAGLFCVLGHIAPIFYRFKGGKGVLAAATMILLLNPTVFLVLIVVFVAVVAISKYISLGSVICGFIYPFLIWIYHSQYKSADRQTSFFVMIFAFVVGFLVIFMHRQNLDRLAHGKENKLSFGKKKQSPTDEDLESDDEDEDDDDDLDDDFEDDFDDDDSAGEDASEGNKA